MQMYYVKRVVIGATARDKKPLPDCVIVTAFPSFNNQQAYLNRHVNATAILDDDPLVIKAKRAGLRNDYHSIHLPLSEMEPTDEDIGRVVEPDEPDTFDDSVLSPSEDWSGNEPDEPEVTPDDDTRELTPEEPAIEPVVKPKAKKRGRPKKKKS